MADSKSISPAGDVSIRPFALEDYDRLIGLWEAAGLSYRPKGRDRRDRIARELTYSRSFFLLAECGGRLVGSILGTHDGRKGWINRLAVHPGFRHSGIATRLVREVENRFSDLGIDIVTCLIEDWNQDSMAFFEKQGYTKNPDIFYFSKKKYPDV